MKLLDASHPFFRSLWRRVAIVAVSLGWAVFEYSLGETLWALLFAAIGAYCAWALLVAFPQDRRENGENG